MWNLFEKKDINKDIAEKQYDNYDETTDDVDYNDDVLSEYGDIDDVDDIDDLEDY